MLGIRARGLADDELPLTSVEAMAAAYVQTLRAVQPMGPYLLAGWSMGGLLAFETARQLEAAGAITAVLVLLDAAPSLAPSEGEAARGEDLGPYLRPLASDIGIAPDRLPVPGDASWTFGLHERVAPIEGEAAGNGDTVPNEPARKELRLLSSNLAALRDYRPDSYSGEITLIRAAGTVAGSSDPTFGWGAVAGDQLALETVPGDHDTMLQEPYCAEVARRLDELLERADPSAPQHRN